jgi:hypothetical protein
MRLTTKITLLVFILLTSIVPNCNASDIGIKVEQQDIEISISEKGLLVEENIMLNNTGIDNVTSIRLWLQQGIKDVTILAVETAEYLNPIITGNTREFNLTKNNLIIEPGRDFEILLSYTLPTNTENFEKIFFYEIQSLTVIFNDDNLYSGKNLQSASEISLRLYKPTEAPLSITYIVTIFILVVILITSVLLLLRKQRSKIKKSAAESEEILKTKKTLLMSILKDLEKQHRSKSVSDETYNKLKDDYKQQAVEVMKKIEKLK